MLRFETWARSRCWVMYRATRASSLNRSQLSLDSDLCRVCFCLGFLTRISTGFYYMSCWFFLWGFWQFLWQPHLGWGGEGHDLVLWAQESLKLTCRTLEVSLVEHKWQHEVAESFRNRKKADWAHLNGETGVTWWVSSRGWLRNVGQYVGLRRVLFALRTTCSGKPGVVRVTLGFFIVVRFGIRSFERWRLQYAGSCVFWPGCLTYSWMKKIVFASYNSDGDLKLVSTAGVSVCESAVVL